VTPTSNITKATVMATAAASIRMAIWSPRQQGSWCSGYDGDVPENGQRQQQQHNLYNIFDVKSIAMKWQRHQY